MHKWLYSQSLLTGWIPAVALVLAIVAVAYLLLRRSRLWLIFAVASAGLAMGIAFLAGWLVIHVLYLWPEDLPADVIAWAGVGVWAILLALGTYFFRPKVLRAVLVPVAAVLVMAFGGLQINNYFGEMPTVGALVNGAPAVAQGLPRFLDKKHGPDPFLHTAVAEDWKAPRGMKEHGVVREVVIPGTVSHFKEREAVLYLPAAYFVQHRPALPVLVLVSGQPGGPTDFLTAANLQGAMDSFAQAHNGLAPIVVIPDPSGTDAGNTMCMNSNIAKADTYMAVDVPHWIKTNLDVDSNPAHWAVGGFSYGGTCAVQMATRHPHIYPTFAAISSELEPALTANRAMTIQLAFGGDAAKFDAVVPMTLLKEHKYPGVQGWFAAGAQDAEYTHNALVLHEAADKAGMKTVLTSFPGGHSWKMVTIAFPAMMDWLAGPLGLNR